MSPGVIGESGENGTGESLSSKIKSLRSTSGVFSSFKGSSLWSKV